MTRFYCTYCSAKKKSDPGKIPAINRYDSPRIRDIHRRALADGAGFLILSGEFGLLPPSQPIPYYDHLLKSEEAGDLAQTIARQLGEIDVSELVYFTESIEEVQQTKPYLAAITGACQNTKILLRIETIQNRQHSRKQGGKA